MAKKTKLQIYVPEDVAQAWRDAATSEGSNLSAWIMSNVTNGRTTWRALMNLHGKVDKLLEGTDK